MFTLYLDLDGVTASENYIVYIHEHLVNKEADDVHFKYRNFMQQYCLQEEAVEFLNTLYDKFAFEIVISSTRRYEFTPSEWDLIFRLNGVKAYVTGRTGKVEKGEHSSWRESEILAYQNNLERLQKESAFNRGELRVNAHLPFLVIDDDIYDLHEVEDKLIKVDTKTGLTPEYLNEAYNKIKAQNF